MKILHARRKQLSIAALYKLNDVWIRKDKIRQELRIKLYKSLIKPILLYNCGTWGLTKSEEEGLNSFHRRQLRHVLNIKYPAILKNSKVYDITKENVLSLDIIKNRWNLLGHTLRLHKDTPAQKSMDFYFEKLNGKPFRGSPRTTIPLTIHNDMKRDLRTGNLEDKYVVKSFVLKSDLENLRLIAIDRDTWKSLTEDIIDAAKAEINI